MQTTAPQQMTRSRSRTLFALTALVAACGAPPAPPADSAPPDALAPSHDATGLDAVGLDATAPDTSPPPPPDVPPVDTPGAVPHSYTASIGPITLAPGEERTVCVLRRLGNVGPEYVRRLRANLGDASHHLIVYRSSATAEQTTPFNCGAFSGVTGSRGSDGPLMIAEQRDTLLDMPPGVGMNVAADQMIRLEFHTINVTAAPLMARAEVVIDTVERTASVTAADLLFWGNLSIAIPPRSTADVHYFNRPPAGARVFGLTSHTHRLGVRATIHLATNTGSTHTSATDLRELHRAMSWSEPGLTTFDPALSFEPGQGMHLVCSYNNTTSTTVGFGESALREMCFMWAYYYPATNGFEVCLGSNTSTGCAAR